MQTEQLTKGLNDVRSLEWGFAPLNQLNPLVNYITDRAKALLLEWFSALLVLVSVSVLFHLLHVYI